MGADTNTLPYRIANQLATYWAPNGSNGFGGFAYITANIIKCRWVDGIEIRRNVAGVEIVSTGVCMPVFDVLVNGKLALGEFTDDTPVESARRINEVIKTPNLKAAWFLREAFLS